MSRWAAALWLGLGALLGCEAEPGHAAPVLEGPLRDALLTTPLACTERGAVVERVMKTEDHGVVACHGFVGWNAVDGMRLDIDRYPTIVEVEVDPRPIASHEVALSGPYLAQAKLIQLQGRVVSVVAGQAPVGAASFSVLTLANWNLGVNYGPPRTHQGGWPMLRLERSADTRRGVVFLPTEHIDDVAMLGCAEGHVVWIQDDAGRAYLQDLRRIRTLDRQQLAAEGASLSELRVHGGALLGAFVAEYAPPQTVLLTLEGASTVTPFDRGLAQGLRRMLAVLATDHYPAPVWEGARRDDIRTRLDAWADKHDERLNEPIDHGGASPCRLRGGPSASSRLLSAGRRRGDSRAND